MGPVRRVEQVKRRAGADIYTATGGKNSRAPEAPRPAPAVERRDALPFRKYQRVIFEDHTSGMLILHWSRQIGKSYTLAAWAVSRLLRQLQRYDSWLITVLSNSRDNGAEFDRKCAAVCEQFGAGYLSQDESPDLDHKNLRMECRVSVKVRGQVRTGRIKVLAANPRTARGFSGDLILDEFAFHEDSAAIWEAAEPILSANREFLCRIASTGNGRHNMFYRMAAGSLSRGGGSHIEANSRGVPFQSANGFMVSRVTRTAAHAMGVEVYDPNTREAVAPAEARSQALDKRAYDQNYECAFNDENMALLTHEMVSAAERSLRDGQSLCGGQALTVDEQQWSAASLERMARSGSELFVGNDIGRQRDLSVVTVLERVGAARRVVGMLRMNGMRLPAQKVELEKVCRLPNFRLFAGDMTGIGLGLVEFLQEDFGSHRIRGVNFASTEPMSERIRGDGRKGETARVTEIMAMDLLGCFEDRSIEIPADAHLREDLVKPEKITSPGGRVSIAATRDEAGHADHFWSLALAVRAARSEGTAGRFLPPSGWRARVLAERRDRSVVG